MFAALLLNQLGDQARPTGLVARAQARAGVAMKIFMEQEIIPPARVGLQQFMVAIEGPPALLIAQEEIDQPVREMVCHAIQRGILAGAGRALDQKIIAVIPTFRMSSCFIRSIFCREAQASPK